MSSDSTVASKQARLLAMPLAGPQEDATDRDTLVAEANS
mgnify:CR=1 FL=1